MNPFSLPNNDLSLFQYREQQRSLKHDLEREQRSIPIYDRSPEVKIPVISEFRKSFLPSLSPGITFKVALISNRENLDEFIQRKREILFVKKSIENKKQNIEILENTITEKEKNHRNTMRQLEEDFNRVEKYEENLMIEAGKKSEMTESKIKERLNLQAELARLSEEIEIIEVLFERKREELKKLEKLKEFVEEIVKESLNDDEQNMFITQQDSLFKTPIQILDSINVLEINNLFQVRQIQEVEAELEALKTANLAVEKQIIAKNEVLEDSINILEKQKESLSTKLKNISKEEKEPLVIDEQSLEEIHQKLIEIVSMTGLPNTENLTDLEMLEIVESCLEEQLRIRSVLDEESVKKLEKEADKTRRGEKIQKIKEQETKKRLEVNEKLQQRKNKHLKKTGRPTMNRSKLPEKIITTEKPTIPQDVLDRAEFLDELVPI